jgi:nucleoside-diphosphate-sugar epimerase
LRRGIAVRCLARPSRNNRSWVSNLPVEIVEGDLQDPDSLSQALDDVDYVIHIAGVTKAKKRQEYFTGNVEATRNILDLSTKLPHLKKFCFVSSLTAVGPSPDGKPFDERASCNPISAYGLSKLEAERVCLSYSAKVPIVILRPPTVYGPRDKDVLELFKAAKLGFQPRIGSDFKTLSLIYVTDLARAIVEATLSDETTGRTYFVSEPTVYDQTKLFDTVGRLVGRKSLSIKIPLPLVYAVAAIAEFVSFFISKPAVLSRDKARDLAQDHWICSAEKIKDDIGFTASTTAEEGLRTTYEWYKANKWL